MLFGYEDFRLSNMYFKRGTLDIDRLNEIETALNDNELQEKPSYLKLPIEEEDLSTSKMFSDLKRFSDLLNISANKPEVDVLSTLINGQWCMS